MVTLKANYQETLKPETVKVIDELVDDYQNYGLDEILDFVDTYGESNINHFEDYIYLVNNVYAYGREQEVIEEYIDCIGGIKYVSSIDVDCYLGNYDSKEDFIDQHELIDESIPNWLVIDYDATWEANLRHDYYWSDNDDVWRSH